MAHSQFLQDKALMYNTHLSDESSQVSICRLVLKDLEDWIKEVGHDEVIAAIDFLLDELLAVLQELHTMNNPGMFTYCQEAYNWAYGAGQKYDDGEYREASAHISGCQKSLHKAIK